MVSHTLEVKGLLGKKLRSVLAFRITQSDTDVILNADIPTTEGLAADLIEQAKDGVNQIHPIPFEQLLEKTEMFVEIATGIAEVCINPIKYF